MLNQTPLPNALAAGEIDESIEPFLIEISQAVLDDLASRLERTRWPKDLPNVGWACGATLPCLQEMTEYWRSDYDWRKHEAQLNRFPQFTTTIDGANVHFLHARSPEEDALPLLLVHGCSGSVVEFLEMIEPLSDPRAYGGDPSDAFHVIIPSLPGSTFSGPTPEPGWDERRISRAFDTLAHRLGYEKYGAHGGGIGSAICRDLAVQKAEGLVGIHVLQLFLSENDAALPDLTGDESALLEKLATFPSANGRRQIQAALPQMLGYALADSPVAQLARSSEIFSSFGTNVDAIDRDLFLTNVMLQWLTRTVDCSTRLRYEEAQEARGKEELNTLPTAVAVFPDDFPTIPRFAARANKNIVHWAEFDEGGHFAAMEVPETLVDDIRVFFRRFR